MRNNYHISYDLVYSVFFAAFILLYCFNSVEISGIKLFYFITPLLLLLGVRKLKKKFPNKNVILAFVLITGIGSLFSIVFEFNTSLIPFFTFLIVLISILPIIFIKNIKWLRQGVVVADLIFLIQSYSLVDYKTIGRFEGFFNDPNYFCIVIIMFQYLLTLFIQNEKSNLKKTIYHSLIFLHLPLIIFTASRSGIGGEFIFLSFYGYTYFNRASYFIKFATIVVLLIGSVKAYSVFSEQINYTVERMIGKKTSDKMSSKSRIFEANAGVEAINTYPIILFVGSGIGSSNNESWFKRYFENPNYYHRLHSTPIALIVEHGGLALLIYAIFQLKIFLILWRSKLKIDIGVFLSINFMAIFIWTVSFLPYWVVLFFITRRIYHDRYQNITY
jgi:hypothetical protein